MGSTGYVHGSTDAREVAHLEKQAHFTALHSLPRFEATPGMRVLDLGTGVGAMAGQLLRRYPGIRLVGVDLQERQLEEALGPTLAPRLRAAAAELRALPTLPGASMDYVPWIARGFV